MADFDVEISNNKENIYKTVQLEDVHEIVHEHFYKGRPVKRMMIDDGDIPQEEIYDVNKTSFYAKQKRVALKDCGVIDPENIEEYMAREVLPHIPDAQWFFEENLAAKTPVIKIGAEIPFTRYFYKYQKPEISENLELRFIELEKSVSDRISKLFK